MIDQVDSSLFKFWQQINKNQDLKWQLYFGINYIYQHQTENAYKIGSINSFFTQDILTRYTLKPSTKDPTHRRLTAIQRYLYSLVKHGELNKGMYKKFAHGMLGPSMLMAFLRSINRSTAYQSSAL